jgi:hypothetical protein
MGTIAAVTRALENIERYDCEDVQHLKEVTKPVSLFQWAYPSASF